MDKVIQLEVILNMLNTLLAKANFFKDKEIVIKLNNYRNNIYYGKFDYAEIVLALKEIEIFLKKYE